MPSSQNQRNFYISKHDIYRYDSKNPDQLKAIPFFDSFLSGKERGMWIGDKSVLLELYGGGNARTGKSSFAYVTKYVDTIPGQWWE